MMKMGYTCVDPVQASTRAGLSCSRKPWSVFVCGCVHRGKRRMGRGRHRKGWGADPGAGEARLPVAKHSAHVKLAWVWSPGRSSRLSSGCNVARFAPPPSLLDIFEPPVGVAPAHVRGGAPRTLRNHSTFEVAREAAIVATEDLQAKKGLPASRLPGTRPGRYRAVFPKLSEFVVGDQRVQKILSNGRGAVTMVF